MVLLLTKDILINPYKAGFHAQKSKLRIRHEDGDTVSCLLIDVENGPFLEGFHLRLYLSRRDTNSGKNYQVEHNRVCGAGCLK